MNTLITFLMFCSISDGAAMCSEQLITVNTQRINGQEQCQILAEEQNKMYVDEEIMFVNPADNTFLMPRAQCRTTE